MAMAWIWTGAAVISVVFALFNGTAAETGAAVMEGAEAAVKLCISICGVLCLWSGVMEILNASGASSALMRLLSPVLRRLFPQNAHRAEVMAAVSENVSANMLGLGNAATPPGIKAASLIAHGDTASDDLCMFVVLNTASVQLIPATVAAVRAAAGAEAPLDILPAVWLTSLFSVCAGITAAKLFGRIWKR